MILYVSWGGTGWAASVREAMRQAVEEVSASNPGPGDDPGLRYLAVLDDAHFADLDRTMLALVKEELQWLLDAQLELTRHQLGAPELPIEVVIGTGDVLDAIVEVIDERGPARVLVGAPVPSEATMEALTSGLRDRAATEVSVVGGPS
jgi:hypothetical protein